MLDNNDIQKLIAAQKEIFATSKEVEHLIDIVATKEEMDKRFDLVDDKFELVNKRFDSLERKLGEIAGSIGEVKSVLTEAHVL